MHSGFYKLSSLLILLVFLIGNYSFLSAQEPTIGLEKKYSFIRVLIQRSSNDIELLVKNPVYLSNSRNKIALIKANNTILFKGTARSFQAVIRGKIFESDEFILEPADSEGTIFFANKYYPGKISFRRDNTEIQVINKVALEPYVAGVVVPELGRVDSLSLAAVEAMAVCARTYACNKINEKNLFYDLEAGTQDQVYKGLSQNTVYNKRVESTKDLLLYYQGEIAKVFYYACCGGVTESVENVFKIESLPYLVSVKDGDPSYCSESPVYQWKEEYTEDEFLQLLIQGGLIKIRNSEQLQTIEIVETFPSGRAKVINGTLSEGSSFSIPAEQIRPVIRRKTNKGILRSNFIDILLVDDGTQKKVVIKGRGNGHGVGLCQWGSMGMAKQGLSYQQILEHYFPGTTIVNFND